REIFAQKGLQDSRDETMNSTEPLFKVTTTELWSKAQTSGILPPSPIDVGDGFMHLSAQSQLRETLRLHFAGQDGLMLLEIDQSGLGEALVWEVSRGGALFPHVYGAVPLSAVLSAHTISVTSDGQVDLPA